MPRVLDSGVTPTYVAKVTPAEIDKALDLLQVRGYQGQPVEKVITAAIVAIAKHLDRGGSWMQADDEPEQPKAKRGKS